MDSERDSALKNTLLEHDPALEESPSQQLSPNPPVQGTGGLEQALDDLAIQHQQRLSNLLAETRRCEELATALPPGAARTVRARHDELVAAVLDILTGWQALGGTVRLAPPGPIHPLGPSVATPPASLPTFAVVADHGQPGASAATGDEPHPARGAPVILGRVTPTRYTTSDRSGATVAPVHADPGTTHTPAQNWAEDLAKLLGAMSSSANAIEEMDAIQRAASASFSRWIQYPRSVQRALVGNLACRLRHLQDHLGVTGSKLDSAFRSLTRFSKSFQPGWVNGLTRVRGPAADSWAEEARCWWEQLLLSADLTVRGTVAESPPAPVIDRERLLADVTEWLTEWRNAPEVAKPMCLEKTLSALEAAQRLGVPSTDPDLCRLAGEIYDLLEVPRFRRLRQAIRDVEMAQREDEGVAQPDAVPSDWSWWSHTVGRRALFLGPALEEELLNLVEASFGLAQLRWRSLGELAGDDQGLQDLLGKKGADLVLLAADDPDDPALRAVVRDCQLRDLPWVHVEHGVGVTRIRMAIERFLQPDPRPRQPSSET